MAEAKRAQGDRPAISQGDRLAMFEAAHETLEEMLKAATRAERANRLCGRFGRLVGARETSLFLHDPAREAWRCLGGTGKRASCFVDGFLEGGDLLPLRGSAGLRAEPRSRWAIRSGSKVLDLKDRCFMTVPVAAASRVPGLLLCEYDAPHTIDDPALREGIRVLLSPVGALLECYQEMLRLQQRVRALELLREVCSELSSIRDEDRLLEAVGSLIDKHLQVDRCSIMIFDKERRYLTIKKAFGMPEVDVRNVKVAIGEGIAGFVAAGTRPLLIKDVAAEKHLVSRVSEKERFRTNSLLSVPLVSMGETLGVINVNNRRDGQAFSEEDKELLCTIGSEIAAVFRRSYIPLQRKKGRDLDRDIKQSMI